MKKNELEAGMKVMHEEWDSDTSESMEVVEVNGKLMLRFGGMPDTNIDAGGESEDGWFEA